MKMDIVSRHCRPAETETQLTCHQQLDYPDENMIDELKHTNAFIDAGVKAGGNVLIHWCVIDVRVPRRQTADRDTLASQAGVSRSATALCAYLMKSEGLTRDEAFRLIKSRRKQV